MKWLARIIVEFSKGIWKSFFTDDEGASARKLSAFAGVVISYYITIVLLPKEFQLDALHSWLVFALLCLGIVTIEQIVKLFNGNKNDSNDNQQ
jgi:hypothetical protein